MNVKKKSFFLCEKNVYIDRRSRVREHAKLSRHMPAETKKENVNVQFFFALCWLLAVYFAKVFSLIVWLSFYCVSLCSETVFIAAVQNFSSVFSTTLVYILYTHTNAKWATESERKECERQALCWYKLLKLTEAFANRRWKENCAKIVLYHDRIRTAKVIPRYIYTSI